MKQKLIKTFTIFIFAFSIFLLTGCNYSIEDFFETPSTQNKDINDDNDEPIDDPIIQDDPVKEKEKLVEKINVKLGIDLIDENLNLFKGKRVGLITNATGVNSELKSTIDILNEKTNLVALFAPEHGIRGAAQAGDGIANEIDQATNLPVYSLYGSVTVPTKEMMDKIDILCIDIQDVGARFYTYIYTMTAAMIACAKYNKPFVVFDRPNPISGSEFEGNILDTNFASGIGRFAILQRHGMTIGEIAKLFNEEFKLNCGLNGNTNMQCDLTVIKMKKWDRSLYIDQTTCPWILPSPNMPTVDTATVYTGTCIFEGTNLSEGRGTTRPFELIGAPYIDALALANRLNNAGLEGVYFRPTSFTPTTSKNANVTCNGVQVHVTDRCKFKAVKTGWTMYSIIKEMYPTQLSYTSTFNHLAGCDYLKNGTYNLNELYQKLLNDTNTFASIRSKYLLY